MVKIYIPDGPQPLEYWSEWRKSTRQRLMDTSQWAMRRTARETSEGVAAEPVNFPCFEDEIVIFPRNINIRVLASLINDPEKRKPYYQQRIQMMASNFAAKGRGEFTFLILPQTSERILAQIETRQTKIMPEVMRITSEIYFKGKHAGEIAAKITTNTLNNYLQRAEEELDILGSRRGTLNIVTRTLDVSYGVFRMAREEGIDFRRYFRNRIF